MLVKRYCPSLDHANRLGLLVSFVLLLAFGLRLHLLADQSIWWDEGISVWAARKGPMAIALWTAGDNHPPIYYWVLHFWLRLAGESEFAARFPSVASGVLTVALLFELGRKMAGPGVGLLAAFLAATARFSIWWSQETRMYALAAMLCTASLYFFWAIKDGGSRRQWAGYLIATYLALGTHYLSGLVLLVENCYLVVTWLVRRPRPAGHLIRWLAGQLALVVLHAPWLVLALGQLKTWRAEATFCPLAQFLRLFWLVMGTGISTELEQNTWLSGAVMVLAGFLGLVFLWWWVKTSPDRSPERALLAQGILLFLLSLLAAPLAVYLLSLPRAVFYTPPVSVRYLLVLAPFFYLFVAWGIGLLGRKSRPLAAVCLAAFLTLFGYSLKSYYDSRFLADDFQSIVGTIRALSARDDAIILDTDAEWPVFAYHSRDTLPWYGVPNAAADLAEDSAEFLLGPALARHSGLWLLVSADAIRHDPARVIETWLDQRLARLGEWRFGVRRLVLFSKDAGRSVDLVANPEALALVGQGSVKYDGVDYLGYEMALRRLRSGEVARVATYWRANQEEMGPLSVEVDLAATPEGPPVARSERVALGPGRARWPQGAVTRAAANIPITGRIAPGRYWVRVRIFDDRGLTMAPLESPGWGSVPLRQVQVDVPGSLARVPAGTPPSRELRLTFGGKIALLGFDLPESGGKGTPISPAEPALVARPGDKIRLVLYWQGLEPIDQSYAVFVHILGQGFNPKTGNPLWGQKDGIPVGGTLPTTSWLPGQVIPDPYEARIEPNAPPGDYQIEVGLYDPTTGRRLAVTDPEGTILGDRAILVTVRVRP
jgi:4-amino-4-deoxy-L-arabinose transferase-like glycosyltransferase